MTIPDDLATDDALTPPLEDEVARINEFADELNREAEDVLEYQTLS